MSLSTNEVNGPADLGLDREEITEPSRAVPLFVRDSVFRAVMVPVSGIPKGKVFQIASWSLVSSEQAEPFSGDGEETDPFPRISLELRI